MQGSLQALQQQLDSLQHAEVEVRVLHAALGTVTESDVSLAIPTNAVVLAFRVGVHDRGRIAADRAGIDIRHYEVIYTLLDDIRLMMEGQLAPEMAEEITGHVEVRRLFPFLAIHDDVHRGSDGRDRCGVSGPPAVRAYHVPGALLRSLGEAQVQLSGPLLRGFTGDDLAVSNELQPCQGPDVRVQTRTGAHSERVALSDTELAPDSLTVQGHLQDRTIGHKVRPCSRPANQASTL